jgi:hypothetical protein
MLDPAAFHFIERFTQADLEEHPVWRHYEEARDRVVILSWGVSRDLLDEETEKFKFCGPEPLYPVLELGEAGVLGAPGDRAGLNIRVRFESQTGDHFAGYVIEPHAFGIFYQRQDYCFNRSLPSAASRTAEKLASAVSRSVAELFPIRYSADLELARGESFGGEIARFW